MNKHEQEIEQQEIKTLKDIEFVLKSEFSNRVKILQIHSVLLVNTEAVKARAWDGVCFKLNA